MKKLRPLAFIIAAILVVSCSEEPLIAPDGSLIKKPSTGTDPGTGSTDTTKTGGNGNTGGTSNSTSYLPMTAGSSWTYLMKTILSVDTITVTMTNDKETVDNKVFFRAELQPTGLWSNNDYYFNSGNSYTLRRGVSPGLDNEIPVLKADVPVNGTWTVAYPVSGAEGRFVGTMKGKNISHTVNGKVYNNVLYTQVEDQIGFMGMFSAVTTYNCYFAKGVGLIEFSSYFNGNVREKRTILTYTVK